MNTIHKVLMWLWWGFMTMNGLMMAAVLTRGIEGLNSFDRPFEVFAIGTMVFPAAICGLLRWWVTSIRHPWGALAVYAAGVYMAASAGASGIFLVPEFFALYQVLGAVLLILFCPALVNLSSGEKPPPLPKSR